MSDSDKRGPVAQYQAESSDTRITHWLRIIHAEYREMPGLRLTKPEMQRLFGIEPSVCDAVVDALVDARVLRHTRNGYYMAYATRHS